MNEINNIKRVLKEQFKMTDLGLCKYYLGMEVTPNYNQGLIYLSLSIYIIKVLCQFGRDGYHSIPTPIDQKEYLNLEQSNIDPDLKILEQYQLAIGHYYRF